MRVIILILICFIMTSNSAEALFEKKDYKQKFLHDAISAEKRKNDKSAFHLYEKTMYYYPNDVEVIEAYAKYTERRKFYDKAIPLYEKLYVLTKNSKYLMKRNLCEIKGGQLSNSQMKKLVQNKALTSAEKVQLNTELIYHFANESDWESTKSTCSQIDKKDLNNKVIVSCIVACEKLSDSKSSFGYYIRYSELYPKDVNIIKKILTIAEKNNDYSTQEMFVKKLSDLNPKDVGIKYRLAGLYQKSGEYDKALKVYEALMASGDKSKHVKDSYAYILQLKNPTVPEVYQPKPKTALELKEEILYSALDRKDFKKASSALKSVMKLKPNDPKMIKLGADIAASQKNYTEAIAFQEQLNALLPSIENAKLLAFYYSQAKDYVKALGIIESLIAKTPESEELTNLAYEYALADKNWDKALGYISKLLIFDPKSEKILKMQGDLYSMKKNFDLAIDSYETLVQIYPKPEYYFELSNFYMAVQNFSSAAEILSALYCSNRGDLKITKAYVNSLLALNNLDAAYQVVVENHLEDTLEGFKVYGDLAMKHKDYFTAQYYYQKALRIEPEDAGLKKNLAASFRGQKKFMNAECLYREVFAKDPKDYDAIIGLGYIEVEQKNYEGGRRYFNWVLSQKPCYQKAKMGIVHSYLANGDKMHALDVLSQMPVDDEVRLNASRAYYEMGTHPKTISDSWLNATSALLSYPEYDIAMNSEATNVLRGVVNEDAIELRKELRKDRAITITPSYSLLLQKLADKYDLDINKWGISVSQLTNNNKNVFMEYNMYIYSSGKFDEGTSRLNNITNELRAGVQRRVNEKFEYRADIGGKFFQYGGALVNTDSWLKYFFNDNLSVRAGFRRNNVEQSYLSAVGFALDGVFTGRVISNNPYIEYDYKLPNQYYTFGRLGYGALTGDNIQTNQYIEGMIGIGRTVYNNPDNKWIQTVNVDLVSYNASYQYNLLNIYDSTGTAFGGYYSPEYFTANTANIKIEGEYKKWRLRYGFKGFVGGEYAIRPNQTGVVWDVCPYLAYELNDHVTINLLYNHFNFADITRDQIIVNAVIRGK